MKPWTKNIQANRYAKSKPAPLPHWIFENSGFTITATGKYYFLTTTELAPTRSLSTRFELVLSTVMRHSDRGMIPTQEQAPAIKALGSDMSFPYESHASTALADYAFTTFAHEAGFSEQLRFRIERMDLGSWTLLVEDINEIDNPPIRVTFDGESTPEAHHTHRLVPHASPDELNEILGQLATRYHQCEFALPEHNKKPDTQPTVSPPTERTRRAGIFSLFR